MKEPNGQCAHPQCPEPQGQGDGTAPSSAKAAGRRKRSSVDDIGTVDVHSRGIEILDIQDAEGDAVPTLPSRSHQRHAIRVERGVCMSPLSFALTMAMVAAAVICAIAMATFVCTRRAGKM